MLEAGSLVRILRTVRSGSWRQGPAAGFLPDETASAQFLFGVRTEVFPEPGVQAGGSTLQPHTFNQFFPWQTNEDGEEAETLNHIGRHELHSYFDRAFTDDANVTEFIDDTSQRFNPREVQNLLQMREDPQHKGTYFAIDAPGFARPDCAPAS